MHLYFLNYCLEYEGEIFGRVLGDNVYFQMSWYENEGDLKCKHDGQDFDGDSSYHNTYAQCSGWPKNQLPNATITLELDGNTFETTPEKAIEKGRYPIMGSDCAENNRTKLDIGFVFATSNIANDDVWNLHKMFVKQILRLHNFGVDGIQAGVVIPNDNATLKIKFSAHSTKSAFETALDQLDPLEFFWDDFDQVKLYAGLETTITAMFNPNNGMRADSKKVAILLSDGIKKKYNNKYLYDNGYVKMAQRLQQSGIRFKVVTFGEYWRSTENPLKLLVSHDNDYVYAYDAKQFFKEGEGFEVDDIC